MKDTAVEWLFEQLDVVDSSISYEYFEQAKAMEKEQMHKCASFWKDENEIEKPIFEQYYKKTFKSE